jgi:hypothetical protein
MMEHDEDPGPDAEPKVEINDRRTSSRRPQDGEPDPGAEQPDGASTGSVEPDDLDPSALYPRNVKDILYGTLLMLTELAWERIGLRANPSTGKVEVDIAQAKMAIDTVAFIVDQLAPSAPADQRRDLSTLVANLKINFAKQAQASPGGA